MKSKQQRGIALIVVLMAMSLVLLTLLTALAGTQMSGRLVANQLMYSGQALQAANAGLNEGLSWFRRQSGTITAFKPILDPGGVCPGPGPVDHTPKHIPPKNDTDNMTLGIVREYEISTQGRVWARFEARKNPTPADGNGVIDVTRARGASSDYRIWQLESEGIIYVKNNPLLPYDTAPNVIISRRTMRSNIRRIEVIAPTEAALCTGPGKVATLNLNGRVRGGTATGVAHSAGLDPVENAGSTMTGAPRKAVTTGSFRLEDVFGTTRQELELLADYNAAAVSLTDLPYNPSRSLPPMSLILIHDNAVFNDLTPLSGSGVIVVFGNLTVEPDSYSSFSGTVYVTGNVTINAPAIISGTLISNGNVILQGTTADLSEVAYDADIAAQVRQRIGQFRFTRASYNPNAGS